MLRLLVSIPDVQCGTPSDRQSITARRPPSPLSVPNSAYLSHLVRSGELECSIQPFESQVLSALTPIIPSRSRMRL